MLTELCSTTSFDYRSLDNSRKQGGAAEQLDRRSRKTRLSVELECLVRMLLTGAVSGSQLESFATLAVAR